MTYVKEFMLDPNVYRYAAEYGASEEMEFNCGNKELWLTYDDIGLINLHVETGSMCRFHPYIKREHKDKYDGMIKEFFKWFIDNMQAEAVKLNAIIPVVFDGAQQAARRAKMTVEGIDRMSYRTEKGACDRILYGITKEEMKWVI